MTTEQIIKKFDNLSKPKQVDVLHSALELMQQYNGWTINTCICLAMGYYPSNVDDDNNEIWKKNK